MTYKIMIDGKKPYKSKGRIKYFKTRNDAAKELKIGKDTLDFDKLYKLKTKYIIVKV